MNRFLSLAASFLFLLAGHSFAQSGTNDASFNSSDIGLANGDGFDGPVYTYATQADGKILAGGSFGHYNGYTSEYIIRLLPNGKVDSSFHAAIPNGALVEKIIVLSDGKILVGGNFNPFNGSTLVGLVRLLPDGSIDDSFNTGGAGADGVIRSVGLQSDGKIIIAGDFTTYNGVSMHCLSRLNEDGTLDLSFNSGSGISSGQRTMVVLPDDKILIGGMFSSYNGTPVNFLVRLSSDGTFDNTFNISGSGPNNSVEAIALQNDGKILIGGLFTTFNGTALTSRLARLNPDGTLDNIYASNIQISPEKITAIAIQNDGKAVVGQGYFNGNPNQIKLLRLNDDGSSDGSFTIGYNITSTSGFGLITIHTINVQNDGNILVGGNLTDYNYVPANYGFKLDINGSIDPGFNTGTGANGYLRSVKVQPDGKILIGGDFTAFNGAYPRRIAKLNADGTPDTGFSTGLGANAEIRAIGCQTDGKIIIGGGFTTFNSVATNRIARLNADGSLDNSFNIGSGANDAIDNIIVQADGKIIVGGNFTTFNGVSKNRIIRLNADGSVDNTFSIGSGLNDEVYDMELQSDGKIIVVGEFTYYNGTPSIRTIRLNTDGSKDVSFDPQNGANYIVQAVDIQEDGKIVIGGGFSTYNNVFVGNIARLNADGTLDNTFNSGSGVNSYINALEVTPDQKIVIGGYFTVYNGNACGYIAKLDADGSLDSTFDAGPGANNYVNAMTLQEDGKILIGGTFTSYNTEGRNRVARILNCLTIDVPAQITEITCYGGNDGAIGITPTGGISPYSYQWSNGSTVQNLTGLVPGIYSVIVTDSYGCSSNQSFVLTQPGLLTSTVSDTACVSYTWLLNGTIYTTSGQYTDTIQSAAGCDSVIVLDLTINQPTSGTDTQISDCATYTWIDGITYYASTNTPTWTLQNAAGCDSVVTLDLTMIPSVPTIVESTFSLPSDPNSCVGEIALDISGNPDFELTLDNGAQTATTSGYHMFTNLCPGIHDAQILNFCGDTTTMQFVIPVDSNYVFNNPFIDSLAQDSLGTTLEDCDIYYAGIDSAYIDSIWANGNTVNVIWNIVDSNGSNFDTTSYVLNNGNGVYWLQLSVLCPNKSIGDYFTVTEAIYFENGTVSSAGITELDKWNVQLYPNPTNNLVTISFDGNSAELTVYDAQGKLIRTSNIHSGEQVSLREMETGVYFFQLTTEQGSVVKRVVKN